MKYCPRCTQTLPETEFYIKIKKTGQLNPYCKCCQKLFSKENYESNKQSYIDRAQRNSKKYKERNTQYLLEKKVSCVKCGEDDLVALDMHHLDPHAKDFAISDNMDCSESKFKEELNKCVVLCASCHRKFHAGRFEI